LLRLEATRAPSLGALILSFAALVATAPAGQASSGALGPRAVTWSETDEISTFLEASSHAGLESLAAMDSMQTDLIWDLRDVVRETRDPRSAAVLRALVAQRERIRTALGAWESLPVTRSCSPRVRGANVHIAEECKRNALARGCM